MRKRRFLAVLAPLCLSGCLFHAPPGGSESGAALASCVAWLLIAAVVGFIVAMGK